MRIIQLRSDDWSTALDFYNVLLYVLGAPEWHGKNINALTESMIWDNEINTTTPPYTILISGTENVSKNIRDEIDLLKCSLATARDQYRTARGRDVDVQIETSRIN